MNSKDIEFWGKQETGNRSPKTGNWRPEEADSRGHGAESIGEDAGGCGLSVALYGENE